MQKFCEKAASWGGRRLCWLGLMFFAAGMLAHTAIAQPTNDNWAAAEEIFGVWGSVTNDTSLATAEPPLEPNHGGFVAFRSIWYKWTAPQNGEVQLDTLSSTNDTVLAVYTGSQLGSLRQIAANDEIIPLYTTVTSPFTGPSALKFTAKAGTTYYIAVASKFLGGPVILGWAYHSGGVFRFATEDVVTSFVINTNPPSFQIITTPIFRASEWESSFVGDSSTYETYYQFGVPGVLITVTRVAGSSGRMLVDYATADVGPTETIPNDIPAVAGQDYLPVSGTLAFDDHEMTKRIVVPIFSDAFIANSNRNFSVILTNARRDDFESPDVSTPRLDGGASRALVRILDMDIDPVLARNFQVDTNISEQPFFADPTNSVFNFSRAAFRTVEDVGGYWADLFIWVDRYGTNRGSETVHYRINNFLGGGDNADPSELDNNTFPLQPGSDYATPSPADDANGNSPSGIHGTNPDFEVQGVGNNNYQFSGGGTLSWGQNDFLSKAIRIRVTNDLMTEFNEDFRIYLYQTVDNATRLPGTLSETVVTILFDDQDPPAGSVDQFHNPDFGASMAPPITTIPPNMAHPGADNTVYGLVVQSDNKTVIVGDFVSFNATPRGRIARLNFNGSLDTTFTPGSGANGSIAAIAQTGSGQFVIGGGFTAYNGSPRTRIARLNANGTLDTTFTPGLGANDNVWAIALQADGKVIVAGDFTSVAGETRNHIARLNANGTLDTTFNPGGNAPNGTVWALALQADGKVIIGGEFTAVGGHAVGGIARLNADGTLDGSFAPGAGVDGIVYALALQADGKILAGGQFSSFDFNPRNGLVRLNADGTLDGTFDAGSRGTEEVVYSIVPTAAGIYVGGRFDSYNGTHRRSLVRLYADGTVDTGFLDTAYNQFAGLPRARFSDAKGTIFAMGVQSDGNVMIGGIFDKVGGGQASSLVRPEANDFNTWVEPKARDGMRNRSNIARLLGGVTPGPGNLSFTATEHAAQENQSSLSVSLTRHNGTLGYLSANFEIEEGLAQSGSVGVPGVDYTYQALPPIYVSSWQLPFTSSEPNATTRMHSDGLAGDNFIPTDIYGRNWFGYTPGNLIVTINNDFTSQGDRNTSFRLSNPSGADQFFLGGENIPLGGALGFSQAPFTLYDDDQQNGVLVFASANFVVNENVTNAVVTVIRTNGSYGSVSVQCATVTGGTATAGVDYQTRSTPLTFANGQTSRTFLIPITDDPTVEPDETIFVRLSGVTGGATIGLTNAIVTIVDNDTPGGKLNFAAANFSTNEAAGSAIITVTRSGSSVGSLTVYAIATNGTATAGLDFTGVTNVLSWSNGDVTPKSFTVPLLDDVAVEPDETVTLRLLSPTLNGTTNLASLGPVTNATLTILNDDLRGAVQYSTANYTVNEHGGAAIVTVVRAGGSAESLSVNFAAVGASAVAGVDFVATNGTLAFGPGEVSKSFEVMILNNGVPDVSRFLTLVISNAAPAGTLGSPSTAIINIVDDESVNEPPGGNDTLFTASGMNDAVLSLALQADGKILAAGEFTTANQVPAARLVRLQPTNGAVDATFTAAANASVQSVAVQDDGRILVAGDFTFVNGVARNYFARLQSNGAVDSSFNPGAGADNPVLAVAPVYVGNSIKAVIAGSFAAVADATRNGIARLNYDGSVDLGFDPGTGADGTVYGVAVYPTNSTHAGKILICGAFTFINGTMRPGVARLNSNGSVDLSFNPGSGADAEVRTVAIQTDGRILIGGSFTNFNGVALNRIARLNDNGTVDVAFNAGVGANDTVLSLSIQGDTKILAGGLFTRFNGVTRHRITRLNNDGSVDPTINFGAGANDFVAATLTQPDGKILIGGGFTEYDGVARQRLARIYGGSVAGSGTLEFTAANYSVLENATNAVLTVRRYGGTAGLTLQGSLTVEAISSDGTATNGVHYLGGTSTLTFAAGEVFQTITVPILDDAEINSSRVATFALGNILPGGTATLGNQPSATLTIINDDSAISFSSPTYARIENAVDGQATIGIIRTGATNAAASVDFTTGTNGTATAGADFIFTTNSVVFAPGETFKSVTVPLINDTLIEGSETVSLVLSNVNGAYLLAPFTATLTIVDDDLGPGQISFTTTNFIAGEAAGNAIINLIRTNGASGAVSVRLNTSDLTAAAGFDYVAQNNITVAFGDGETNKTVLIPILDDVVVEGDESFLVTLGNPTGGASIVGTNSATVRIVDNDMGFSFSTPFYVVTEAGPTAVINVLRLGGSSGAASVYFSTTNVTASAGLDYVGQANVLLSFANGEVQKNVAVNILEDTLVEGDETFGVLLSNPSPGLQLLNSSASVTIVDNDTGFSFGTNSFVINEDATNLWVTVYRTNANTGPASVVLTASNLTAVANLDYSLALTNTALNFTNGEALKLIPIQIVNDVLPEGDETFQLELLSPSAGAQLVGDVIATATIVDNDAGVRFSNASYIAHETNVSVTVTVLRETFTNSTVAVSYATADGTALAGTNFDYIATSGQLVFTNGETAKTFTVQILDDMLEEGLETVLLSLSSPTGQVSVVSPGVATLTIVDNDGGSILPAGSRLTSESGTVNGAIEPGETVTVLIGLRNVSGVDTTNLVATLLATNGVTSPSAAQNYGALVNNGDSASRSFSFTANGTNGAVITPTFLVQEQGGGVSYGRVTFNYLLGNTSAVYSNTLPITINDNTIASPYPSSITVTGLLGTVSKAVVTVSNIHHLSADDIDMLLVGPTGASTMLMSDAGGLSVNITNVALVFDDVAPGYLPDSTLITSGTYRPSNYGAADLMPSPAPAGPWGSTLASFNSTDPNGLWSLYIYDDLVIYGGGITHGWRLTLTTLGTLPAASDLSVRMTATPATVVQGSNITYSVSVTNHGPWAATGVQLTNAVPAGSVFVGATTSAGSVTTNLAGQVVWTIGALALNGGATATMNVAVSSIGNQVSTAMVDGVEADPNDHNNVASVTNLVVPPSADLGIVMVGTPNPLFITNNSILTYNISVTNAGPSAVTGVVVSNALPPEVTFLQASPAGYVYANGAVTFTNLGSLGVGGAPLTATITVRAVTPGLLSTVAEVSSSLEDPSKGNNTVEIKTLVNFPAVEFARTGNNLIISWPAAATGYILETTTNLAAPTVWTPVTVPPPVTVGGVNYITNSIGSGNRFFRLRATAP